MAEGERRDYTPQYVRIQNYIISKISSGEFKTGDKIPSENEISRMFSVSRITANTALRGLVSMGVIERVKGKGSFVKSDMNTPTAANVFSGGVRISTKDSPVKKHEVASIRLFFPPQTVREKFGIGDGEQVFEIIRPVKHLGELKYVDYTYIPAKYLRDEVILSSKLGETYIHDYLKKYGSLKPSKVRIFLNTPMRDFLDLSYFGDRLPEDLFIWDTEISDETGRLIAFTVTAGRRSDSTPFISFSLS